MAVIGPPVSSVPLTSDVWIQSPSGNSSITGYYDPIWSAWNYSITTGTGTIQYQVTDEWLANNSVTSTNWYDPQWTRWNEIQEETEEQIRARERREAEQERLRVERNRIVEEERVARAKSEEQAKKLLMSALDAKQKRDVLEHGWFEIISDKGRRWRIRTSGYSGNVDLMPEEGEARLETYCGHAPGGLPPSDHHLAQMLYLQTDEENFLRVANRYYQRANVA